MKKIICLLLCLTTVFVSASAQSHKMPKYDITGAGSGNEGTVLVKVFIYEKKADDQQLKCAAVHGIVFRGVTGNNSGAKQPPMAPATAELDNATFCSEFFTPDGQCQNFASIVDGSYERVKTSKGYKNGAIVQINKSELRKYLEKAGLVRSLSSGF